jgi:diguanylate cyclase (GGDEF)-like protein/PAS domain S-box-containing protein
MMNNAEDLNWQNKRAKYIMENIKDVVWELDPRLVFTYISPRDKEQRGYDTFEVIGQHLFTFLTDASQKYVLKATTEYAKSAEQGKFSHVVLPDVQQICKNGHIIWTEITINPVIENGALVAFVGATRDITDRKTAEAKLTQYAERLEQMNQQLKRMSASDTMTRVVFNRDKLEKGFYDELTRAKRYKVNLSVVVFNVDFLKRVNDAYGNVKADDMLKELEGVVTHFIRDNDFLYRRGGDEFIVLLPHTTKEQGRTQAERLRQKISLNQFSIPEPITISAGVTEYIEGDTLESVLQRADMALYIAKRAGKNQVETR